MLRPTSVTCLLQCDGVVQSTELCGVLAQFKATSLHKAAGNGHRGAVQLLLTAKANPNAEDRVSDSPCSVMELCRVLS